MSTVDQLWTLRLSKEAFDKGKHIPKQWSTEYDTGGDGCMPQGWYLIGRDTNGFPIDFPIRHEYGPFDTEPEAKNYSDFVMAVIYSMDLNT